MDRRSIIKHAGIAGILAAGAAPAAHAQTAVRWRLASSFPKSLDTLFGAEETLARKVNEMSGGKFVISTHAAGELMPAFGVVGNTGAQMGGWYRKEIKSVADMKGLKFRVGGFAGKVMERMGVVPQNIPAGEIYQSLEKGTLDAAEWIGPYDDQKLGLNKVAPYYYYPAWWEGGPQLEFFVNSKAWDALSPENKSILETAAAYAHQEVQAKYDVKNPTALKQLVGAKTKVLPFSKDIMDRAYKESMQLYSELSAKNPNWKKVYEDFAAFRKEQNQWFRFTEARFDNFMQAQKM